MIRYFISYAYTTREGTMGYNNTTYNMGDDINCENDIRQIEYEIQTHTGYASVKILNYTAMQERKVY